jgi:hypothetical protein
VACSSSSARAGVTSRRRSPLGRGRGPGGSRWLRGSRVRRPGRTLLRGSDVGNAVAGLQHRLEAVGVLLPGAGGPRRPASRRSVRTRRAGRRSQRVPGLDPLAGEAEQGREVEVPLKHYGRAEAGGRRPLGLSLLRSPLAVVSQVQTALPSSPGEPSSACTSGRSSGRGSSSGVSWNAGTTIETRGVQDDECPRPALGVRRRWPCWSRPGVRRDRSAPARRRTAAPPRADETPRVRPSAPRASRSAVQARHVGGPG